MKIRLLFKSDGQESDFVVSGPETTIGRGPDNRLVLTDYGVSRHHCRILFDGVACRVEDLGSRNGTKVNGGAVRSAELRDGDVLMLGRFPIRVSVPEDDDTSADFVIDEEMPFLASPGTIVKPMTNLFRGDLEVAEAELPAAQKPANILVILTQVARALISADSLDEILGKVMDLTFEHLPAERGFLMLYDEKEGCLLPKLIKQRDGDGQQTISISKTITEKVYNEQVSILTSDASIDPRFSGAESIIIQGIRSAMCVPLWNEGEVVGVLHVDSLMANNCFGPDDLDMLTALGNYSAVAIQRARLHQRVREETEARGKLERYHSPGVVTKILASGSVDSDWIIEVQERDASVLFADIVGFTSMSENLTPAEVARLLNHYFGEMTSIVFEHDGTLDKFIGDALMAVFGAPIAQKNHAERAVRAALAMQERLAQFDFKAEVGLDVDLQVRVGINSGNVVAGDIGSHQRMDYTVIGDTVNAASRLEEDIAGPGEIVVGEATWKPVKKKFKFEEIGSTGIRGRKGEMLCFKVLGQKK